MMYAVVQSVYAFDERSVLAVCVAARESAARAEKTKGCQG
jgi:hypothetical protein